jgi:hypothetical protein
MTAREKMNAILSAPALVIVLDEKYREVERHHGFKNMAAAQVFNEALELPKGWTTVLGLDRETPI